MSLPVDLVLVRHGQSEGNAAKRLPEKDQPGAFVALTTNRHSRSYRLSGNGREQARVTGEWLAKEFLDQGKTFDRFIVSEYTRAMETAALLNLPDASWYRSFYLTERDWGDIEGVSEVEQQERFADALKMRSIEPFFWRPPNGESFAELCLRLEHVLQIFDRHYSEKRVIVVCHGEVMRGFRVLLERMSQQRFKNSYLSKEKDENIHNCEILHYSRKDPESGRVEDRIHWLRRIRPTETPVWNTGWQKIERSKYSNETLLKIVAETPATFEE